MYPSLIFQLPALFEEIKRPELKRKNMTRYQSQILYGLLILGTGIIIALLSYNPSRTIQYAVAGGMLLASIFAFITASKSVGSEIPMRYNNLQGLGMLAYALAIFTYATTLERFIFVTMIFALYFGITEMIFGFQLMRYKTRISMAVIIFRMASGFILTIGAVLILTIAVLDKNASLLFTGLLIALSGINFIWFAGLTKKLGQPY